MRLPEKLNPSNMSPVSIVNPSKLAVELSLKAVSSARMEVLIDDMPSFGEWVKIYYPNGDFGIFRASIPETNYDTGKATLTLDHGVKTLADNVIEVGDTYDENGVSQPTYFEGTVSQVFTRMLGYQKTQYWVFGSSEASDQLKVEIDFPNLLQVMNETMQQIPDYYIQYDQSVFPWVVNIKRYPTAVTAEGRLSRNIKTAKVRYDDSDLCTRVYCDALNSHYMDSQNIGLYGIREQRYYLSDVENSFAVKACQQYLKQREKPKINVTIEGADFSEITGVSLDRIKLGDLYRLAIAARNVTIEEQITGINYPNIVGQPYELTVTLANDREDLSSAMAKTKAKETKSSTSGSKAKSTISHVYEKLQREAIVNTERGRVLHAAGIEFDENGVMIFAKEMGLDTNAGVVHADSGEEYVPIRSAGSSSADVIGRIPDKAQVVINERGTTWSKVTYAGITGYIPTRNLTVGVTNLSGALNVTAERLTSDYVNEIAQTESHITQTASQIRSEVQSGYDNLESSITQTAGEIRAEVRNTKDGLESTISQTATQIRAEVSNTADGLQSSITQESDRISLVVEGTGANAHIKPASIVASINDGASTIKLDADHIDINGVVTKLESYTISCGGLTTGEINCTNLTASDVVDAAGVMAGYFITPDYTEVLLSDASVSGNVLTITKLDGSTVTFSKATSLSGGWSGGRYTVTASPQGTTNSTKLQQLVGNGNVSVSSSGKIVTRNFYVMYGEDGDTSFAQTGANLSASINASTVYNNGWTAAYNKVFLPYALSYSSSMTAKAPDSTVDTARADVTYTVSADNSYAYIKRNNVIVARASHSAYTNGWSAAYNRISIPYYPNYTDAITIKWPGITVDTSSTDVVFTVSADDTYAYIKRSDTGTTVAQVAHSAWQNGYDAGYAAGAAQYSNSMSIVNCVAHIKSNGETEYLGQLYYKDDQAGTYEKVTTNNRYWYYSTTRKAGTTTVHY